MEELSSPLVWYRIIGALVLNNSEVLHISDSVIPLSVSIGFKDEQ